MGIYDREYYRDKTRGAGWLSGAAPACKAIIVINIAAFVAQKLFAPGFDDWFQATSSQIFGKFQIWRLLTATFLHDGSNPFHLVMNMLFLWMVGREMEAFYGTRDFVAFYVSAAIVSTLAWAASDQLQAGGRHLPMIGASGAVMATIVLYTLYYPRREVILFIFPVEMWFLLVLFIGSDLLQFLNASTERVAYASHLGGAAFGYLYKTVDLRYSTLEKWAKQRRRPKLRIVSPDPREASPTTATVRPSVGPSWSPSAASTATTRPAPTFVIPEEQIDEKLDEILIKIARDGRDSLNEQDNRILDEASRRARNRRSERI